MVKRQKDRQHNGQKTEGQTTQWSKDRRTKRQIMIYKALPRKLKLEQQANNPTKKWRGT
jgi:hypothetical protein